MTRWMVAVLAVLVVSSLGCSKKPRMDLPTYPGAAGMAGGGVVEANGMITWHQIVRTPDSMAMVRVHYEKELVTGRGWVVHGNGLGAAWNNGNMTWAGGGGSFGTATPDDPTKEGGFVQLIETDRETIIDHWQSKPLLKK